MSKLINKLRVWCNTDNGERPHSNKTYNKNKNYIIGRIIILGVVMFSILAITGCGCGGCNLCGGCGGCFDCSNCFGCNSCSNGSNSCAIQHHNYSYSDFDYYW